MAAVFRDREARASLSYMAQVWLRLADNYRDANKVIAAPNGSVEVRPTVQQQQQLQPKNTS
jgi:phosphoribosylformylglycinamidine (FGAM) synthase-like amidotransferase family enzyme